GALKQAHHMVRRVPIDHVLAEKPVEMRVAIHRIAADDEPGDLVGAELDGWQQRIGLPGGLGGRRKRRQRGADASGKARGLQEITARGAGLVLIGGGRHGSTSYDGWSSWFLHTEMPFPRPRRYF